MINASHGYLICWLSSIMAGNNHTKSNHENRKGGHPTPSRVSTSLCCGSYFDKMIAFPVADSIFEFYDQIDTKFGIMIRLGDRMCEHEDFVALVDVNRLQN